MLLEVQQQFKSFFISFICSYISGDKMICFIRYSSLLIIILLTCLPSVYGAVPHEIAGIELGTKVHEYADFEDSNYLKETVVMDWHGFDKGIIYYGICHSPGTIVKIQMKYQDSSKAFFNVLMKKVKKKYGPPSEWEGDSFGINHIWKWKFIDKEGRKVNMILHHNLQDKSENMGNQLKLYYPELMEQEHLCFLRQCQTIDDPEQQTRKEELKKSSWKYLIPQE
jgi:hypothetical protein